MAFVTRYTPTAGRAYDVGMRAAVAFALAAGCAQLDAPGSEHRVRLSRPAAEAAACLARNAEAHSSALAAQVTPLASGAMAVTVRVRNGVTYAEARIEPQRSGSSGTLMLHVVSSRGQRELIDALVAEC